MPAQTVIQIRRDTAANWTSTNPTLASGEIGFESDTNQLKVGNGTTAWTTLPYASGAGGASVEISETAPADPEAGDVWFNSTDGRAYIYYDSTWVDLNPGIAGPSGVVSVSSPIVNSGTSTAAELSLDRSQLAGSGNAIINGAFEINQRGFTTSTTDNAFGFDRWRLKATDGTTTHSAQTFTLGSAPVAGYEGTNFHRIVSSGQTLANARSSISHSIEDVRTFAGQTITVSFFARAGAGTPKMALEVNQNFGAGGSAFVAGLIAQATLSTSWQRFEFTATLASIAGKTLGTGSALTVDLYASAGSDFNARTDSLGIQSGTFDIWGVQVEAGSTATSFRRNANSLQGELAACKRYFERHVNQAPGAPGHIDVGNRPEWMLFYDEKRADPSITVVNSTNILWVNMTSSSTAVNTGFQGTFSGTTTKQARLFFSVASGVSNNTIWTLENTGPFSIDISAEL